MANILKKAAAGLLEMMLTSAQVVEVRAWQPATLYEVDVYLPAGNMEKWNSIKRFKCKVAELEYRDYTPALWNPDQKVCTLYIEAGHQGAGSRWVQRLHPGDEILLGVAHAASLPSQTGKIIGMGDGSALGHFLALKQLTDREKNPMEVAIYLHDTYQLPASLLANNPEFEFIENAPGTNLTQLAQWFSSKEVSTTTSVYIAGNIPLVTGLRKRLKAMQHTQVRIYAHGFWS